MRECSRGSCSPPASELPLISPVIVASSVEAINTLVKQLALRADFDFQTRVYSRSGLSEALKRQTLPADVYCDGAGYRWLQTGE